VLGATIAPERVSLFGIDRVTKHHAILAADQSGPRPLEIDYSWLPLCAETYKISPDIRDYVFASVPILSLCIPNRNLQAFDFDEVLSWDVNQGKPVYKTFIGKPTYTNHKNNTIPHLAKGCHFDAVMEPVQKYGIHKVNVLLGFCSKKDAGLTKAIARNIGVTGYSMGAMVESFLDTVSGKMIGLKDPEYQRNKGQIDKATGRLRYLSCSGVTFFETSCLGDFGRGDPGEPPADPEASAMNSRVYP
jgi:hypothetical protein